MHLLSRRMRPIWFFLITAVFYIGFSTGFTFKFQECELFPNYNMLAEGFSQGNFFISESPAVDTLYKDGRRYIFSGPVPALLRLPLMFIFGCSLNTGVMISFFCACVATFFFLTLNELLSQSISNNLSILKRIFVLTFVFNGISLNMVAIPSIHNESISASMCFLMISIFLVVRLHNRNYNTTLLSGFLIALSLSFAVGSRFSCVYTVIAIGCILIWGILKNYHQFPNWKTIGPIFVVLFIGGVSIVSMFYYNYVRFGSHLNFGMAYMDTMYEEYFVNGGYFRYGHFPYNFWSHFFRLPHFISDFPFIKLPAYLEQVQNTSLPSGITCRNYLNANELVVSVFFLMPILLFLLVIPFRLSMKSYFIPIEYLYLFIFAILQLMPVLFTVASIARYYYDYVPIMMILSYIGAARLKSNGIISNISAGILGALSLIISFSLPMNAIQLYATFIQYESPLLNIF